MTAPTTITVPLGERTYEVTVGRGILGELPMHLPDLGQASRAAVVTQEPVARHHVEAPERSLREMGLEVARITIPDGEAAKDLAVLQDCYHRLAAEAFGRRDVVVAVGGGVVGDLAGFLAATWHRGVPVVQVPTTLLAQVDAAVGGKTAVNLVHGKNLVGAFHQPVAVVADVDALVTLEGRIRREGFGEIVKYGLIRDQGILDLLEAEADAANRGDPDLLHELVVRSVRVKAAVVAADEHESGQRAHLNLGHTYGHAVEACTGYDAVLHGEAVAIGMCLAARLGVRLGVTAPEVARRTETLLRRLGLPVRAPRLDRDRLWAAMDRDKKARAGEVAFVVLEDVGTPTVLTPDRADVDAVIDELERE